MKHTEEITLENLFREAKTAVRKQALKKAEEPVETPLSTWTNPANWQHSRFLILLNKGTVFGIYDELIHTKHPESRRLILAPVGTVAEACEEIIGNWQFEEEPSTHYHVKCTTWLTLAKLNFVAGHAQVNLHFAYEHQLLKVVLETAASFVSADTSEVYEFVAGTDLLPVLAERSKTILKTYSRENSCAN